jgi:hypothetical protein
MNIRMMASTTWDVGSGGMERQPRKTVTNVTVRMDIMDEQGSREYLMNTGKNSLDRGIV